jgi:hypothetical protein
VTGPVDLAAQLHASVEAAWKAAHQFRSEIPDDVRLEILSSAIRTDAVPGRVAALRFLSDYPDDALALLPDLVWLSVSHAWAGRVRETIARIPGDSLFPRLDVLIAAALDTADEEPDAYDDYRRHAELLEHVAAWDTLRAVTERALTSADPDVHEVGDSYLAKYGHLWSGAAS